MIEQGRVSKSSWPNMRRREPLRGRRDSKTKLRMRNHHQGIKSNRNLTQVKVIMHLLVNRLLHGIAGIPTFIRLWIIVGCICNHITFNILLYLQIMLHHKDRLLPAMIWSKKILIAAKRMRRTQSKIQSTYSRGGVPQSCLIPKSEDCNVCARRKQWSNK